MGEAKRRKQNDPNFGNSKENSVTKIKESLVVGENDIRFISSLGNVLLDRDLLPPDKGKSKGLNRQFSKPLDCHVSGVYLTPTLDPRFSLKGFFFTKSDYSRVTLFGTSEDDPESLRVLKRLNVRVKLLTLANEIAEAYHLASTYE